MGELAGSFDKIKRFRGEGMHCVVKDGKSLYYLSEQDAIVATHLDFRSARKKLTYFSLFGELRIVSRSY